jgi:hypothetical protein
LVCLEDDLASSPCMDCVVRMCFFFVLAALLVDSVGEIALEAGVRVFGFLSELEWITEWDH